MSAFSDCSAENEQNMNILKRNIPDMDILSNPLLDFFKNMYHMSHFIKEKKE